MRTSRFALALFGVTFLLALAPNFAHAQAGGRQRGQGGQGAQGNQGQQRGNFDPAQARERSLTRIKEQLSATDEEWKVLQPKVEKLLTAQQDMRSGRGGPGGQQQQGRGNRGQRGQRGQGADANAQTPAPATPATAETSAVAKASADLRAAVSDKSTSGEDISKKLTALHEAKAKAKTDRDAAEKELKELLTARQEAILVNSGLIS